MRHLFVMDPLEKLDPQMDTSLRMAYALNRIGHECFAATPWQLYWKSGAPGAAAFCQQIVYDGGPESAALAKQTLDLRLSEFKTVHMRKDPPFDMDYITATWLLESAPKETIVLNSPKGLRSINEKAVILRYPQAIAPALISADPEQMLAFIKSECQGDGILKPLTLYSGKGIHRLSTQAQPDAEVLKFLQQETKGRSQRLLQPFDNAIFEGEVRVFAIHGEPLAWCLKKPAAGDFMANSSFGSTRHAYQPSSDEIELIRRLSLDLRRDGIEIVGYDLIGGKVSEINVTSPRLLVAPDDHTDYFKTIADWLAQN